MTLRSYDCFKFSFTFDQYTQITDDFPKIDNMPLLLNFDYRFIFKEYKTSKLDKQNFIKQELVDEEYNIMYLCSTELCLCTFDIASNTVYVMSAYEYNEYFYSQEPWPYDKEAPTEIELAQQNLISSTKISLDNFIELMNNWHQLNLQKVPFALLYQNEQDWIACKGFDTQEDMEAFIKQHSDEQS